MFQASASFGNNITGNDVYPAVVWWLCCSTSSIDFSDRAEIGGHLSVCTTRVPKPCRVRHQPTRLNFFIASRTDEAGWTL